MPGKRGFALDQSAAIVIKLRPAGTFEARDFARSGLVLTIVAFALVMRCVRPIGSGHVQRGLG
jgi:hypothetical protein